MQGDREMHRDRPTHTDKHMDRHTCTGRHTDPCRRGKSNMEREMCMKGGREIGRDSQRHRTNLELRVRSRIRVLSPWVQSPTP